MGNASSRSIEDSVVSPSVCVFWVGRAGGLWELDPGIAPESLVNYKILDRKVLRPVGGWGQDARSEKKRPSIGIYVRPIC